MAKFKFNFGSDTSTTLFHNANASGNDFNMYTSCHTSGEPVFGNIRVTGTSVFSNATFGSGDNTIIDICGNSGSNYYAMLRLCPSGTQNSYLRFGGDLFVQTVGGTDLFTICDNGKVGIGTASPQRQLHVHCSSSSWDQCASLRLSSENTTNFYGEVQFHRGTSSTDDMGLNLLVSNSGSENLTPKFHVNVDGNVGIGTTTPDALLHVNGTGTTASCHCHQAKIQGSGCQAAINFTHTANGGQIGFGCFTGAPDTNTFFISNGYGCPACGLVMSNAGKVGIGCVQPAEMLDVAGNMKATFIKAYQAGTSGNSYYEGELRVGGVNTSYGAILGYSALNSGRVNISNLNNAGGADSTIKLGFGAVSSGAPANTVMTVNQLGNVGIGTDSPGSRLHLNGTSADNNGIRLSYNTWSANGFKIEQDSSTAHLMFRYMSGSSIDNTMLKITYNGDAVCAAGDVVAYAFSDCRVKNNLKLISCPIDKIKVISGYEFDWNTKDQSVYEGNDVGVIAQEVEKVLPQIVCTRDTGYKAIKYEKIVPLLIEATKEQQCTIEKQQRQIDTLTCQVELLLKRCA